jgi:hypothetical protein
MRANTQTRGSAGVHSAGKPNVTQLRMKNSKISSLILDLKSKSLLTTNNP